MTNYPLASSTWGDEERIAIQEVLDSNNFTMGSRVAKFEDEFSKYFGVKHSVMVNSGSSANLLAVAALMLKKDRPIRPGMEVIVPAVSWATTYYPVFQHGLILRFVDIDPISLNIDYALVEAAINPNTAAIFTVNLLGQPSELEKLRKLADKNGLYLIEDNCESMGAQLGGRFAGTWGDLGTFSFYFSHHINTMEGGMITTNDDELYDILLSIRSHGWTRGLPAQNHVFNKTGEVWDDLFRFVLPGYNLRPIEFSAAVGSIQLSKFTEFVNMRQTNHSYFKRLFANIPQIQIQDGKGISSSFGFAITLLDGNEETRRMIIDSLEENGVETRPIVSGNFLRNPVIDKLNVIATGSFPVAERIHTGGFFLGNHHFDITEQILSAFQVLKQSLLEIGNM